MGWLHSRPKSNSKDNKPKARQEYFKEGDPRLELPEADEFIVSCWRDLGLCSNGGYGYLPLPYSEIESYSNLVAKLTPFESSIIRSMSSIYVNEQSAASEEPARACPLEHDLDKYNEIREFTKSQVSMKMRQLAQQAKEPA